MAPTSTAGKPPGRQTNNSLSSIPDIVTPSIVVEKAKSGKKASNMSEPSKSRVAEGEDGGTAAALKVVADGGDNKEGPSRKKKEKSSQVFTSTLIPSFTETEEVLQIGMHKVLEYVKNHKDAWPFMDPVEEDIAPRYYSIIRRPMDLLKMEEKLDNGEYGTFPEFRNDFKLIVNNCRLYNGQNNEYTEMVNNLQEAFEKGTKKYFEQNSSDEEDTHQMEYPDLKPNVFREKASANKPSVMKVKIEEIEELAVVGKSSQTTSKSINSGVSGKKHYKKLVNNKEESDNKDDDDDEIDSRIKKSDKGGSDDRFKKPDKKSDKVSSKIKKNIKDDKKDNNEKTVAVSSERVVKEGVKKHSKQKCLPSMDTGSGKGNEKKEMEDQEMSSSSKGGGAKRKRKDKDRKRKKKKEEDHESSIEELEKVESEPNESDIEVEEQPKKVGKTKKTGEFHKSKSKEKKAKHKAKAEMEESKPSKHLDKSSDKKAKSENIDKGVTTKGQSKTKTVGRPKSTKPESKSVHEKKTNAKDKSVERSENYFDNISDDEGNCFEDAVESDRESVVEYKSPPRKKHKRDSSLEKPDKPSKKIKSSKKSLKDKPKVKCEEGKSMSGSSKKNKKSDAVRSDSPPAESTPKKSSKSASAPKHSSRKGDSTRMDDDLMSISSSPLASIYSSAREDLDETFDSVNSSFKKESSQPSTPEIKDKFDLIKERRSKSNNSKSSDKFDMLIQAETARPSNKSKKEKKSKHDREHSKESEDPGDSKISLFDRLRDDKRDTQKPARKANGKEDEYDFVDDLMVNSQKTNKADNIKPSTNNNSNNNLMKKPEAKVDKPKAPNKGNKESSMKAPKSVAKASKKTNMEALELETEQTLKDINRWLEHTPRFPEFSSASNSPSRYILDDFDAVDPNDFRRPVSITAPEKAATVATASQAKPTPTVPGDNTIKKPKEGPAIKPVNPANPLNSNQLPVNVQRKDLKDKRKSLRDKIYNRKKEPSRTIERLQPGKSKGNLLNSIQNTNKPDELYPLGNLNKLKEVKNSLVVKTDESGPKLSLGTVLDTEGFGLIQQHNFNNDQSPEETKEAEPVEEEKVDSSSKVVDTLKESADKEEKPEIEEDNKKEVSTEIKEPTKGQPDKPGATPNLSAWFKAFGAPKKTKKSDDEESVKCKIDMRSEIEQKAILAKSPVKPAETEAYSAPIARTRKASTGSTVSERSSFSQDPDSPRIGIDERLGTYPTPQYSSPMASPILASPKPDELVKSNYSLNGAIKVGFYQDTTQKSSPEKSCSPRELPSPYPQYSQHIYSASSASLSNYANYPYNTSGNNQSGTISVDPKSPAFYDQYKQPRSQDSDYNKSSLSPNTNSPYQQHSPYQNQHSPYDQQQAAAAPTASNQLQQPQVQKVLNESNSSAYNQTQQSPYPTQQPQQHSPVQPQQQQTPQQIIQPTSPYSHSNHSSPFSQQEPNSPYQQPEQMSPFHPNSPNHSTSTVPTNSPQKTHQDWQPNQSMHSPYEPLQQLQNQSMDKSRLALNDKVSPPMAHAPTVPQQFNQMSQNIQPAHQNYPVYPHSLATAHSKPYDESQSLFMSHQLRNDQNMYPNEASSQSVDTSMKAVNEVGAGNPATQHQVYDHLMALRKSPFGKQFDISTSKALEMFNRAAMGFPKTPMSSNVPSTIAQSMVGPGTSSVNTNASNKTPGDMFDFNYSKAAAGFSDNFDMQMKSSAAASELVNMAGHHLGTGKSSNMANIQQSQYSNRRATDLVIPNPRITDSNQQKAAEQRFDYGMSQMPTYRPPSFSAGTQQHLSSLGLDDRLMHQSGYYDKNLSSNMFGKNTLPPSHNHNQLGGYGGNMYPGQEKLPENPPPAKAKRGAKKKKTPTPTPAEIQQPNLMQQHNASAMGQMQPVQHLQHQQSNQMPQQQQTQHHQQHQQTIHHQGFQSYAGLKTAVAASTTATNSDSSAISLKTASMVPGSAFNFGPTPTGLALSSGIYGENSGYHLDEFRNPANHYYLPPQSNEKTNAGSVTGGNTSAAAASNSVPPSATPPAAYHQFLSHPPTRPPYPFMNSQLDPNSPIYQQYFQRRQEEIRAQMMLNQGLLGPHPGAPPGAYPQPGYHHPSLGMHKPYDSMNRPSWL